MTKPLHLRSRVWHFAEDLLAADPWFQGGGTAGGMRSTLFKTLDLFIARPEWKGSKVEHAEDGSTSLSHPSGAVARFDAAAFEAYALSEAKRKKAKR